MNEQRFDKLKEVIRDNYNEANCGMFFCRNWIGDPMETIYKDGEVQVDICYRYSYFEVFGLDAEDEDKIGEFYRSLEEEQVG